MEVEYSVEENYIETKTNKKNEPKTNWKEFIKNVGNNTNTKLLILGKDPNMELVYLLLNSLYVLDSTTFEVGQKIRHPERYKVEDYQKVLAFSHYGQKFIIIYDTNTIHLYPLISEDTKGASEFSLEQRLTLLKDNESIVKIYSISNENDIPFLILVTSSSKIYYLRFKIDANFKDFEYSFEEMTEKTNFFRKFISNFVPSAETSKVFILNPTIFTKFVKSNKNSNILFLMNESYIKKIEFNLTNKGIEPELNFQINTNNLIIEKLKPLIKYSYISTKNVSIESADIFYDHSRRQNIIYFIVKYENPFENIQTEFFLMQLNIQHETNEIAIKVLVNFSETIENLNLINLSHLIVNKYRKEIYMIFSQPKNSIVMYFNEEDPPVSQTFNSEIRGINVINSAEDFSIDILLIEEGVLNIYYENRRFIVKDKTENFLNKFSKNLDQKEERFSRPSFPNIVQSTDININIGNSNNLDFKIHSALSDYYNKFNSINNQNLPIDRVDYDVESLQKTFDGHTSDDITLSVTKILYSIVDDESSNLDNLNKESIKAELVIIEYLEQKDSKLEFVYRFLDYYKIFERRDPKKTIFLTFVSLKEKLIATTKLRILENNIIDKRNINQNNNYNRISELIYEKLYQKLKRQYNDRPFSKQLIYSKISTINIYFDTLFDIFKQTYEDIKTSREEKVIHSYIIVSLLNTVLTSIRTLHEELFKKNKYGVTIKPNILVENISLIWLIRDEYLYNYKIIFDKFIDSYDELQSFYKIDFLNGDLINYIENILYFYEFYYILNISSENKKTHFELKKYLISKIIKIDIEKSLSVARKYRDFYSIVFICYQKNWIDQLKDIMADYINDEKVTMYFLKLYLSFESQSCRDVTNKAIEFKFFERFDNYREEISKICSQYPKLSFLNEIYLKSINNEYYQESAVQVEELTRNVVDVTNVGIFLKLAKIVNSLNKYNCEDMLRQNKLESTKFVDQFFFENEQNSEVINFSLLVNYLSDSLNIKSIDNKNIFKTFENFINELINERFHKNIDVYMKYKIAIGITALGRQIEYKFEENAILFERLFKNIFLSALSEDYEVLNKILSEEFKQKSIDSLSDENIIKLKSESLINYIIFEYPDENVLISQILEDKDLKGIGQIEEKSLSKKDFYIFIRSLIPY